jgi:hypothetical protein
VTSYRFRILLMVSLCAPVALAEPDGAQKAMANQLFDEAEKLMAVDHAADACAKYAESQRLDPQLGTLLHLGACYERIGKTASAWAAFKDSADMAGRRKDEREGAARERIADLEPKLSRLTIEVARDAPAAIEVKKDGEPLGAAVWGSPVPIDPGPHVITARAAGYKDWQMTIDVPAGASAARVSIPKLELLQVQPPSPPPVPSPSPQLSTYPPHDGQGADSGSSQQTLGYVLGGVGVVGIAVGTWGAVSMQSKVSDRNAANACSANASCTWADKTRIDDFTRDARIRAGVANVGFIAGGAALIGGVVLVVTAKPKASRVAKVFEVRPWAGAGSSGVILGGAW